MAAADLGAKADLGATADLGAPADLGAVRGLAFAVDRERVIWLQQNRGKEKGAANFSPAPIKVLTQRQDRRHTEGVGEARGSSPLVSFARARPGCTDRRLRFRSPHHAVHCEQTRSLSLRPADALRHSPEPARPGRSFW